MQNLAAIVWLYRGQQERFLGLVESYLGAGRAPRARRPRAPLAAFEETLDKLAGLVEPFAKPKREARSAGRAVGGTHRARRRR